MDEKPSEKPVAAAGTTAKAAGAEPKGDGHGVMRDGSSADFPTDADGRVMHLQVRPGQLANRVLSVGDAGRARRIAEACFDGGRFAVHPSTRGFGVYTGLFEGTPVSIVATGMGTPMMDFVVREGTAVVRGELAMVRLGTCGGLGHTRPGNVVVATKGLVLVRQEPDFVHASEGSDDEAAAAAPAAAGLPMSPTRQVPYSISRIVMPDAELSEAFATAIDAQLQASKGSTSDISAYSVTRGSGATADSFYASQGRINAIFDDRNETLVGEIEKRVPDAAALEMESFHLISLAKASRGKLRAAAATIPLVSRASGKWLDADHVRPLEIAGGRAAFAALSSMTLAGALAPAELELE